MGALNQLGNAVSNFVAAPAASVSNAFAQADKDLSLSQNAPLIAAATAAYLSGGASLGAEGAGAAATAAEGWGGAGAMGSGGTAGLSGLGSGALSAAGAAGAANALGGAGAGTAAAGGAAGFFGGTTLGNIGTAVGIASGINALTGGGVSKALGIGPGAAATGTEAQTAADPFAPYRSNLAAMYSGALQPGAQVDITKMPGYSQYQTGVMDPAMEAAKRSGAKSGILYSGNEQTALQGIGQQGYYGFMTDYLNRLATGSGAGYAPSEAAKLGLNQSNLNQQGFMQGLGALSTGLSGLSGQFGTPAGYSVAGNAAQMSAPTGFSFNDQGFSQYEAPYQYTSGMVGPY